MNSSAAVVPQDTSTDIDCIQFTFYAYVIFFGNMCLFGLLGNGLSWAVLSSDRRSSGRVATFLLQTMAVVDNLFLLTAGISHITTAVMLYIDATWESNAHNGLATPSSAINLSLASPIFVDAPPTVAPSYSNSATELHPPVGGITSAMVGAYSHNDLAPPSSVINLSLATPISVDAPPTRGSDYNATELHPPVGVVRAYTHEGVALPSSAINLSLATPISVPPTHGSEHNATELHPPVGVVRAYITAYVTVCVWPLVHITQMWAVWITVLVAFNRYVAICMPFQAHRLCTMRQVRCQMACLGLSIILYNIPRWLEYKVVYAQNQVTDCSLLISK